MVMGLSSALLCGALHAAPVAQDRTQFELTKRYALSGNDRWDYVAYDAVRHHLFISRDSHVQVMDTTTGKQVGEIKKEQSGINGLGHRSFFLKSLEQKLLKPLSAVRRDSVNRAFAASSMTKPKSPGWLQPGFFYFIAAGTMEPTLRATWAFSVSFALPHQILR